MIAYLKGEVVEIEEEKLILECGNIGYNISMPASALDGTLRPGQEVKNTYTSPCAGGCHAVVRLSHAG